MLEDREVAEANAPRGLPHDDGLAVVGEAEARGGDHLQVVCAVAARDRLGERGAVDLGEHLERTPLAVGIKDLPACRAADAARKPAVLKDEAVADHARHAEAAGDVRGDLLEAARDDVGGETVPSEKVDEVKGAGRRYGPLDDVLASADVVSLHCPLTPSTRHLINAASIAKMKPSAILINTGRGPLVDEQAVADALNGGRLAAFGADVLSQEPPRGDNPLLSARNCFLTPHIAWATLEARTRLMSTATENVRQFIAGEPVANRVN